jgi:hypothetical protein
VKGGVFQLPCDADLDITEATFEKMVLMALDTPGIIAPAATATKPAINAYSMRSWPRVSFQTCSFKIRLFIYPLIFNPDVKTLLREDAELDDNREVNLGRKLLTNQPLLLYCLAQLPRESGRAETRHSPFGRTLTV